MAAICTVGNVDKHGHVQMRALVLRDVGDQLALFINATSPKWPALQGAQISLMTYWPSIQIQYRLLAQSMPLDPETVHESWQLRPDPPKRMDWFYRTTAAQSTTVESRDELLNKLAAVQLPNPLIAPDEARGLGLDIQTYERLDLSQANGVHDRQRFTLVDSKWQVETLVP